MASTSIRVSEICYVTAEALTQNRVQIRLKGKIRTILLPGKLRHNLRHLFARTFYKAQKVIAKQADVRGHSNIETTRIHLLSSGQKHQKILDYLRLICQDADRVFLLSVLKGIKPHNNS